MFKNNKIWVWVIVFMVLIIVLLVSYFLYQRAKDKNADKLGVVEGEVPSYGEGRVDANSKSRLKINFFRG